MSSTAIKLIKDGVATPQVIEVSGVTYNPETGVFLRKGRLAGHVNDRGYRIIWFRNRKVRAHRLAFFFMTGEFPPTEMDHVNRDRLDNRWCNLRLANRSLNLANKSPRNKLGFKGISKSSGCSSFVASISLGNRTHHLGSFRTKEDAARAYDEAAKIHHGDFAYLNFPGEQ